MTEQEMIADGVAELTARVVKLEQKVALMGATQKIVAEQIMVIEEFIIMLVDGPELGSSPSEKDRL